MTGLKLPIFQSAAETWHREGGTLLGFALGNTKMTHAYTVKSVCQFLRWIHNSFVPLDRWMGLIVAMEARASMSLRPLGLAGVLCMGGLLALAVCRFRK